MTQQPQGGVWPHQPQDPNAPQQQDPQAWQQPAPAQQWNPQGSSPAQSAQDWGQPQFGEQGQQPADPQQYGSAPQQGGWPAQQQPAQPNGWEPQQQPAQPDAWGAQPQDGQQYGSAPQQAQQPQQGGWDQQAGQQQGSTPQPAVHGILDPQTGEVHPVPDLGDLEESDALLVVVSGPDAGAQILLDTDVVTVGRSPNADIFLDDVTVSRKHAEFVRTPSGFTLRDTGSLNGTYVGRQLIDSIELQSGADVRIGKFRMIFQQRPRTS